jgi:hypothetical protein
LGSACVTLHKVLFTAQGWASRVQESWAGRQEEGKKAPILCDLPLTILEALLLFSADVEEQGRLLFWSMPLFGVFVVVKAGLIFTYVM